MEPNSESKLSSLIKWPKRPVREIPSDSRPGAEDVDAYGQVLREGFEHDLKAKKKRLTRQHRKQQYALRHKLTLALGGLALLGVVATVVIVNLRDRLDAPERVLKEQEAQRAIILGPAQPAWREDPKPGDQSIPPRERWGKTDEKKSEPVERYPQFKKSF